MDDFLLDPLRLSLLVVGLIVVAAVYWLSTRRGRRPERDDSATDFSGSGFVDDEGPEPLFTDPLADDPEPGQAGGFGNESRADFTALESSTPAEAATDDGLERRNPLRFIVLHVVAPDGEEFAGETVTRALEEAEVGFGDHSIYHYPAARGSDEDPVFSVANMVEPGYLDLQRQPDFTTPGISFFMRVPGPLEGGAAFSKMLHAARGVATRLGGVLLDESRTPLTSDLAEAIRRQAEAEDSRPAERHAATID